MNISKSKFELLLAAAKLAKGFDVPVAEILEMEAST